MPTRSTKVIEATDTAELPLTKMPESAQAAPHSPIEDLVRNQADQQSLQIAGGVEQIAAARQQFVSDQATQLAEMFDPQALWNDVMVETNRKMTEKKPFTMRLPGFAGQPKQLPGS